MQKLLAVLVLAGALVAGPAIAQEPVFTEEQVAAASAAIVALELEAATYKELWCGAAFVLFSNYLESQGDTASAAQADELSNVLFDRVQAVLTERGLTEEQLAEVGSNASIVAITQLSSGGAVEFSQDDCTAAAQAQ